MTVPADIIKDNQRLNVGSSLVSLFSLDVTALGGEIFYFVSATDNGSKVVFNSIEYTPLPIKIEGIEISEGKMPRPTISFSNVNATLLTEIATYNDLVGAKLTRIRTYYKYLDDQPEADPLNRFADESFYIERKLKQNKDSVEFECVASFDLENVMIPKRQALNICTHRYYGSGDPKNTCPYDSTAYFDINGVSVPDQADDRCGKSLFDCRLRYSDGETKPMRAFPGIGNFGVPYR